MNSKSGFRRALAPARQIEPDDNLPALFLAFGKHVRTGQKAIGKASDPTAF